jgi:hypothetical protein
MFLCLKIIFKLLIVLQPPKNILKLSNRGYYYAVHAFLTVPLPLNLKQ